MNETRNSLVLACVVVAVCAASNVRADFAVGDPVNLGSVVNSPSSSETFCCISADGLEMYIESDRAGGYGDWDLWVLKRTSIDQDWGLPENLGPVVNTPIEEGEACLSADGLSLCFTSSPGRFRGGNDLFLTTRATRNSPWQKPVTLGPTVNSPAIDVNPWISTDGLELYFGSYRSGGFGECDMYVARRERESDPWGVPANLGAVVNSAYEDQFPCLSPDGLLLFFSDHHIGPARPGGHGDSDMWVSMRPTTQGSWGAPVNLGPQVNGPHAEHGPRLSPDGLTLYFSSLERPGGYGGWDIWQAPIFPLVDFNSDDTVDINDLVILIEHWGQDEPSVDIGPMPWGDGVVDAADLEVLMRYWQQDVNDPRLAAHWRLDETEGVVAADNIAGNDAVLHGGPVWQAEGGKIGGALLLDGVDDYASSTVFVLNPTAAPFSVFAWVKDGAPGQVIVSQDKGANWLMLAPNGALMTDLKQAGRQGNPLTSAAVITDDAWHRVGLTWDGLNRVLYVDDIEVARGTQAGLSGTYQSLYLGAGSTLAPGAFWSGLIDDVRVYDRAVQP